MKKSSILQITMIALLVLAVVVPLSILIPLRQDSPIKILSDEDFLKYDFVGEGTEEQPYLIEDLTISRNTDLDVLEDYWGIYIENTTKYFTIQDCVIKNYDAGILVTSVANDTAKIVNNQIENSRIYGIACGSSNGVIIENNEINGMAEGYGVYLVASYDTDVLNNTIYDSYAGMVLLFVHHCTLKYNNISNNLQYGIITLLSNYTQIEENVISNNQVYDFYSAGITALRSNFFTISNNTISENGYYGIRLDESHYTFIESNNISCNKNPDVQYEGEGINLWESNYTIIRSNLFKENGGYGLNFTESYNNSIYLNAFIMNGQKVLNQAVEYNCSNQWYEDSLLQGNFWQGHNTSLAYTIEGGFSEDLYPLVENPVSLLLHVILRTI